MYFYKVEQRETVIKIAKKVLSIEEVEDSGYSFFNLKFLILVDTLLGL